MESVEVGLISVGCGEVCGNVNELECTGSVSRLMVINVKGRGSEIDRLLKRCFGYANTL